MRTSQHGQASVKREFELSLIRQCPVKCVYCPQELLKQASQKMDIAGAMTTEVMDACIENTYEDQYPVKVHFAGFTEPLKHKSFCDLIERADCDPRVQAVQLYSTGEGATPEVIKRLGRLSCTNIVWHVNAESYEGKNSIMPGGHGDIWKLIPELREHLPNCSFVFMRQYINHIKKKELAHLLAGFRLHWGREITRASNVNRSKQEPIRVTHLGPVTCKKVRSQKMPVVLPDGQTTVCCNDYGLDLMIGNLATQSWSSLDYDKIFRIQRTGYGINGSICHTDCHFAKPC